MVWLHHKFSFQFSSLWVSGNELLKLMISDYHSESRVPTNQNFLARTTQLFLNTELTPELILSTTLIPVLLYAENVKLWVKFGDKVDKLLSWVIHGRIIDNMQAICWFLNANFSLFGGIQDLYDDEGENRFPKERVANSQLFW